MVRPGVIAAGLGRSPRPAARAVRHLRGRADAISARPLVVNRSAVPRPAPSVLGLARKSDGSRCIHCRFIHPGEAADRLERVGHVLHADLPAGQFDPRFAVITKGLVAALNEVAATQEAIGRLLGHGTLLFGLTGIRHPASPHDGNVELRKRRI